MEDNASFWIVLAAIITVMILGVAERWDKVRRAEIESAERLQILQITGKMGVQP